MNQFPGEHSATTVSTDNILHDLTISHQGSNYNVLMDDMASIINILEPLRNVKVFKHQGIKCMRKMRDQKKGKDMKTAKKIPTDI